MYRVRAPGEAAGPAVAANERREAEKAAALSSFFEQCETLRAIAAGRKARSAALLVGSTLVGS